MALWSEWLGVLQLMSKEPSALSPLWYQPCVSRLQLIWTQKYHTILVFLLSSSHQILGAHMVEWHQFAVQLWRAAVWLPSFSWILLTTILIVGHCKGSCSARLWRVLAVFNRYWNPLTTSILFSYNDKLIIAGSFKISAYIAAPRGILASFQLSSFDGRKTICVQVAKQGQI